MKRLIICAAVLGLFAFAPLSAQNNEHRGGGEGHAEAPGGGHSERPAAAPHQQRTAPAAQNRQGPAMRNDSRGNAAGAHPNMNAGPARAAVRQNQPAQNRVLPGTVRQGQHLNADRTPNNGARAGNAMQGRQQQGVGRSNRGVNRPELSQFRRNIQAPRQFHSGSYRAPQGYSYRHWSYGETLPRGYYAQNYWISNFLMFGLFAPPSDLVWVRVGNDALLIDRDSGDIVQVRYGVFY